GAPVTPLWERERRDLTGRRWTAWQRQEAAESLINEQLFTALWYLDRLIEDHPRDQTLRAWRGVARVGLGQPRAAREDFAMAGTLPEGDARLHSLLALSRWAAGDRDGARRTTTAMIETDGWSIGRSRSRPAWGRSVDVIWACVRFAGIVA